MMGMKGSLLLLYPTQLLRLSQFLLYQALGNAANEDILVADGGLKKELILRRWLKCRTRNCKLCQNYVNMI